MGVYIKGIKMPTSCSVCPLLEGDRMDGLCHAASRWLDDDEYWTWYVYSDGDVDDSKPCNCPLIPVPPHGRLGDLDELKVKIKKEDNAYGFDSYGDGMYDAFQSVYQCIDDAPTIIPAEEET